MPDTQLNLVTNRGVSSTSHPLKSETVSQTFLDMAWTDRQTDRQTHTHTHTHSTSLPGPFHVSFVILTHKRANLPMSSTSVNPQGSLFLFVLTETWLSQED
jgi:hypothetical protein